MSECLLPSSLFQQLQVVVQSDPEHEQQFVPEPGTTELLGRGRATLQPNNSPRVYVGTTPPVAILRVLINYRLTGALLSRLAQALMSGSGVISVRP